MDAEFSGENCSAHFKISGGALPGLTAPVVLQESVELLSFHWAPENVPQSSGYDQVLLLAIDLKGQKSCYECPGNFRSAGTAMLRISKDLQGKEVDVYIGVVAKDRSVQSDSQYLGRIQLEEGEPILNTEVEAKTVIPEPIEEDKMIPDIADQQEENGKSTAGLHRNTMIKALKTLDEQGFSGNGKESSFINLEVKPPEAHNEIRARLLNTDGLIKEWLNNRANNPIKHDI